MKKPRDFTRLTQEVDVGRDTGYKGAGFHFLVKICVICGYKYGKKWGI